jgi:hypothetical protein
MIQKYKAQIDHFDLWYQPWQQRMREDRVMRWVVEARNLIVKEGDLKTNSIALKKRGQVKKRGQES